MCDYAIQIIIAVTTGIVGTILYNYFKGTSMAKTIAFWSSMCKYRKLVKRQIETGDSRFYTLFSLDSSFSMLTDYIKQNGSKMIFDENGDQVYIQLDSFLEEYLIEAVQTKSSRYICVMGEFGTGKSTLMIYIFHKILSSFRRKGVTSIIVPMKLFENDPNPRIDIYSQLVSFLHKEYGLTAVDKKRFIKKIQQGKIIIFLDGLDEFLSKTDRLPYELFDANKSLGNGKMIITTRPSVFKSANDFREFILAGSDVSLFSYETKIELFKVDLLCRDQISQILQQKGVSEQEECFIFEHKNIFELCRQHLLLNMVVKTLPMLSDSSKTTDIYELYVKTCFKGSDKFHITQYFTIFERIAIWLYEKGIDEISINDITILENGLFEKDNIIVKDLLFLTQTKGNLFRFIHRSFMEYFVSRGLVVAIRNNNIFTINNIKNIVYHEEISRFAREILNESDAHLLVSLVSHEEPWVKFVGIHFLSRLNIADAKDVIINLVDDEPNFIVKREMYISLAFWGEIEKFHEYIKLLENFDMMAKNDQMIISYFGSKANSILGCTNRLVINSNYPTREMLIDFLGRHGGREEICTVRHFAEETINNIKTTAESAIRNIVSRNPIPQMVKLLMLDMDGVIIDSL